MFTFGLSQLEFSDACSMILKYPDFCKASHSNLIALYRLIADVNVTSWPWDYT